MKLSSLLAVRKSRLVLSQFFCYVCLKYDDDDDILLCTFHFRAGQVIKITSLNQAAKL